MVLIKKEMNVYPFKIVATTVGGILLKEDKVLITKRKVKPCEGKWCLPGGHIKIGESAMEALQRELKEEVGITMLKPKFFSYMDEILPQINNHAVILVFYGKPVGTEKIDKQEVSGLKWVNKGKLNKFNFAFKHRKILDDFFQKYPLKNKVMLNVI